MAEESDNHGIEENDSFDPTAPPVHPLAFDWAIYAHHLRESDLTGEQQRQLIETLWTIATLFVDYGFGMHPVQQASGQHAYVEQACGEDEDLAALIAEDMLSLDDHSNEYERGDGGGTDTLALSEGSPR